MSYIEVNGVMVEEIPGVTPTLHPWHVGDKIKFKEEKQAYTIRACDGRFLICTKPFNLRRTVIYTIVDLREKVRGTENLIFCMGFNTEEQCNEALKRLQDGESEVSYRNRIPLETA